MLILTTTSASTILTSRCQLSSYVNANTGRRYYSLVYRPNDDFTVELQIHHIHPESEVAVVVWHEGDEIRIVDAETKERWLVEGFNPGTDSTMTWNQIKAFTGHDVKTIVNEMLKVWYALSLIVDFHIC